MSGQIRGKIECFLNEGNGNNNAQAFFKGLYDCFLAHPNMTLVARSAGASKPAANIGYYDAADAFGNNCWAVFKMAATAVGGGPRNFDYYVLIQHATASTFGTSPGNPGLIIGSTGSSSGVVGIAAAIGVGGDGNPWKGAGATIGANTKGTPVWGAPVGGSHVHVLPRSNNGGGSHSANRENCAYVFEQYAFTASVKYRAHVVADDDSIVVAMDDSDDNTYALTYVGPYSLRQDLPVPYPLVMLSTGTSVLPFAPNTNYGPTAGNTPAEGGVVHRDNNIGVRSVFMDRLNDIVNSSTIQPNRVFATPEFDEFPVPIYLNESPHAGFMGQIDFIREVANIATHDTSADKKRMVVGIATLGTVKMTIPWDGVTTPKSGITRQGIDFVRAGP
jgi:hypothetical protein